MNKNIQIRFRVDEKEAEIIEKEEKNYQNRSEFFRALLRKFLPLHENREVQIELERLRMEIHKIGININQIVRNNNSELYFQKDKKTLEDDLKKIIFLQEILIEKLGEL